MEIKEKILKFIVKCYALTLHEYNESGSLFSDSLPVQEPLPYLTADSPEFQTMISMTIEEQYRRPLDLDFGKLRALINAKRSEAEDHIRALREDPGYFSETIMDWSEHRRERLLDTSGKVHPVSPDFPQNHVLFWERVIAHMIGNSYDSLINWNVLQKQLIVLEDLIICMQGQFLLKKNCLESIWGLYCSSDKCTYWGSICLATCCRH
jgi:hypothetical protein